MSHRFFDHTGDFGAELRAPTLEGLFEEAAVAFTALLTDDVRSVEERDEQPIALEGVDTLDLLVALGNELLYLFETRGWLARRVEVQRLDDDRLEATAHGEPYDAERHPIARPIKAVTHHGAAADEEEDGSFRGRLIFDL